MAQIILTEQDRLDAEAFLQDYLSEMLPEGDFSRGSFLYDLVIKSVGYTVAYLRAENALALDRASVGRVKQMALGTDRDEAADDALANWFLTRKTGRPSRGRILVHVSEKREFLVPRTTRFYYDSRRYYTPDSDIDVVIPEANVVDVAGISGAVTDRYFSLSVVAATAGSGYDVEPATWRTWDNFSPYATRVESIAKFAGGQGDETTDEFLARAEDAICVRDLNSKRSLRTVLKENFTGVDDVYVAGAGSEELLRDLSPEYLGITRFHVGGHADVYVKGAIVPATAYEAAAGATFVDPRPEVVSFSSTTVADFVAAGVLPGMVLRIYNGPAAEPTRYIINSVKPKFLTIDSRFPGVRTGVEFSIGNNYSNFNNIIAQVASGAFTQSFSLPRTILLPQTPIYRISRVQYYDGIAWSDLDRDTDGTLGASEYKLYYGNEQEANTGNQLAYLECGSDVADGNTVRVEYDTLEGFDAIDAYLSNDYNRVACANVVARGMYAVYPEFTVKYKLRDGVTAPSVLSMQNALAAYINTHTATEELHVSEITAHLLREWGDALLSAVPTADDELFKVKYVLYAPDGLLYTYKTGDVMTVDQTHGATAESQAKDLRVYGITKNNIQYVAVPTLLSFVQA